MKVYLAGPDVFLPEPVAAGEAKKALCARHGLEGVFPLDGGEETASAETIFRACIAGIERADAVIANLTPFRGVSADVGTAFEIGHAFALKKPVYGYSNDPLTYAERAQARAAIQDDGMSIEEFALADNLMLIEGVKASGGLFFSAPPGAQLAMTDLDIFERCVEALAATTVRREAARA